MPESSARSQVLQQLETQLETLAREICDAWLVLSDPSLGESLLGVQEYLQLLAAYEQIASQRYSVPRIYGSVGAGARGGGRYGVYIMDDLLHRFPETPFRAMWRMEFEGFEQLVELLVDAAPTANYWGPVRGDPAGGRPARPAPEQIAVALFELGSSENSRERDRIILNISKGTVPAACGWKIKKKKKKKKAIELHPDQR
jgi:hypothetical protein